MLSEQEFCVVHGYTMEYDFQSGSFICRSCEQEMLLRLENEESSTRWPEGAEL